MIVQHSTRFRKTQQDSKTFHRILQDFARFCMIPQDFAKFYKIQQDSAKLHKIPEYYTKISKQSAETGPPESILFGERFQMIFRWFWIVLHYFHRSMVNPCAKNIHSRVFAVRPTQRHHSWHTQTGQLPFIGFNYQSQKIGYIRSLTTGIRPQKSNKR